MDKALARLASFPASTVAKHLGLNNDAVHALNVILSNVDRDQLTHTAQLVSKHASRYWKRSRDAARINPAMIYGGLGATIAGIAIVVFGVYRAGTMLAEAS